MNKTEQNTYSTKSLNLASYLLVTGKVELLEIDKTNPKEILFIFTPKSVCKELEREFWQDKARVSPKRLLYALNELKDQMFN